MSYQVGDLARLYSTFEDLDELEADPTGVTLTYREPSGTEHTLTLGIDDALVHDGEGRFHVDLNLDAAGRWAYRWKSVGNLQSTEVRVFYVAPSDLATAPVALATVDQLQKRLVGNTVTDDQLEQAGELLAVATGLILDEVGKDQAWLATQTAVPARLNGTCLEIVARVFNNPGGLRSEQQVLGQHTRSRSWSDAFTGLLITDGEARACRRAISGTSFRTVTLESPYSGPDNAALPELPLDDEAS